MGQYAEYIKNSYDSTKINFKTGKGCEQTFSKEDIQTANKHIKEAQHHQSLETCKSQPQNHLIPLGYNQKQGQ